MAEGLLRDKLKQAGLSRDVRVDSAGTHALVGQRPDPRAQRVMQANGINISRLKARQLTAQDFYKFDYVLGMDSANMQHMQTLCPEDGRARVRRVIGPESDANDVADPYFGSPAGFEQVFAILERALSDLMEELAQQTPSAL